MTAYHAIRKFRPGLALAAGATATAALLLPASAPAATAAPTPHVFVIVLENKGFASAFGNTNPASSPDPYLAITLPAAGALLPNYYGIGHVSNDNYIAMVSGQAPNPQNQGDCILFDNFIGPGLVLPPGQAVGTGCVYPTTVPTVANQLSAKGLTWKGYMQDMGNVASREPAVCGHPALNSVDGTQSAVAGDAYATRHNPFVYFHSIIDNPSSCASRVVPLGDTAGHLPPGAPAGTTGLAADLASGNVPNLSFIVPNLCLDGHDFPCTNQTSPSTSAMGDIDSFLRTWVPKIQATTAYQNGGVIAVIFDESDGPQSDSTACCGETAGPNSPLPGIIGPGGGRTGAVVLSPAIRPGTVVTDGHNHYSLLASIEDLFGVARLGKAQTVPKTIQQSLGL